MLLPNAHYTRALFLAAMTVENGTMSQLLERILFNIRWQAFTEKDNE